MGIIESSAYADALRARMLGFLLDEAQADVLELGRTAAGYPRGRYPLPRAFCDGIDDRIVGVAFEAPEGWQPSEAERAYRRHEQRDLSVAEEVADAGHCPSRPYRA